MSGAPGGDPGTVAVVWCEGRGEARSRAHRVAVRAAARLTGAPAAGIGVSHEPGGRPVLSGAAPGIQVSLSHGRGALAVAVGASARLRLGVDVEVVRPVPAAAAIAARYLAPAEAHWLAGLDEADRGRAFLWLWTQKEAVGKALGRGLRGGGMSRAVPLPPAWPPVPAPCGAVDEGGLRSAGGEDRDTGAPAGAPALRALPGEPATASTAFPVANGRLVVGVAVHDSGGACAPPVDTRIRVREARWADGAG